MRCAAMRNVGLLASVAELGRRAAGGSAGACAASLEAGEVGVRDCDSNRISAFCPLTVQALVVGDAECVELNSCLNGGSLSERQTVRGLRYDPVPDAKMQGSHCKC
jgi:hypothetical protein